MSASKTHRSEPFQEPFQGWNDSANRSMERNVERCDTETGCNPHECSRSTGTQNWNEPPYRSRNRSIPSLREGTMERGSVSEPKNNTRQDPATTNADLIAAIKDCCAVRGDDDRNRAALIAECASLSREHQRDMLAHFSSEAAIWRAATGVPA